MRKAVIEIGSNSVRYLFGEKINNIVDIINEKRLVTRLRDSVEKTGYIEKKKLSETLGCVNKFISDAKKNQADNISIIATDVLRKAKNKDQAINYLNANTGYEIKILSPAEEARLAFLGATQSTNEEKNFLVFDIGGGSTEIVYGNKDKIKKSISLPLGAIRTTEEFLHNNPPKQEEIDNLINNINRHLKDIGLSVLQETAIGIGGAATAAACLLLKKDFIKREVHDFIIKEDDLVYLTDKLKSMPITELKSLPGMEKEKADIIFGGLYILKTLMNHFTVRNICVKTTGVLYGYLLTDYRTLY